LLLGKDGGQTRAHGTPLRPAQRRMVQPAATQTREAQSASRAAVTAAAWRPCQRWGAHRPGPPRARRRGSCVLSPVSC
jgi:hypothetical protein